MKKIIIWDDDKVCDMPDGDVILWRGFSGGDLDNAISLPVFIENNAELIRKKYLDWVHGLESLKLQQKKLPDFIQEHLGFDYWAMLPIVEKCNFFKSPQIHDALGLLALDLYLNGRGCDVFLVASNNSLLIKSLQEFARIRSLKFRLFSLGVAKREDQRLRFKVISVLPYSLRAIIWLFRYIYLRWPLRKSGVKKWKACGATTIFFSYMFGFCIDINRPEKSVNPYWKSLPNLLDHNNIKTRWLHIFLEDSSVSSAKEAKNLIEILNSSKENLQTHVALDSFLSLKVILKTLKKWVFLLVISSKLLRAMETQNDIDKVLWGLFRVEWKNSIAGEISIKTCLTYYLIQESLRQINSQDRGVFLQENQGWERGLIHAWKNFNHGELIGFPHTVIRFWDLRYFSSKKTYLEKTGYKLPLPDKVAISGPVAKKEYLRGGYPAEEIVEVEALRYMHLYQKTSKPSKRFRNASNFCLLVLGDYDLRVYLRQMQMLDDAICLLKNINLKVIVKPHPRIAFNVYQSKIKNLEFKSDSIEKLLTECDFVYVGAVTSAAVDAYLYGAPVISLASDVMVNLSPLRGQSGVKFISNPNELVEAIKILISKQSSSNEEPSFFYLNPSLDLWLSLVKG